MADFQSRASGIALVSNVHAAAREDLWDVTHRTPVAKYQT